MTDEARRRVAIHEAAHGYAMWRFGWPIAALSLRPGASHVGITMGVPGTNQHLIDRLDGKHPLDDLDPEARQYVDRVLVKLLIGEEAMEVLAPLVGRLPDRATYVADAAAASAAELEPAAEARLQMLEADPDDWTDDAKAFEIAFRMVGLAAGPYLAWARFEARRIASEHATQIYALADELAARGVIDGHQAVRILQAHERSSQS